MELCDSEILRSMLIEVDRAAGSNRRRLVRIQANDSCNPPRTKSTSRNCRCARCSHCIENARWDSIFRAKFADPNYYGVKPVKVGSSLSSWE